MFPRRHRPFRVTRRRALMLVAAALLTTSLSTLAPPPADASARDAVNALTRHFASLQVGPGHEFRLVAIHPLYASTTAKGPEEARLAAGANPDTLGFMAPSGGRTLPLRLDNLVEERLIVFPGQIVRSDRYDLAFTEPVVVQGRGRVDSPLAIVSAPVQGDAPRPERRILPAWLPPTLRWAVGPDAPERDLPDTISSWVRDSGVEPPRLSAAELARGATIHERVADYVRALGTLSRAPAGLQTVGYAAVVDGTPLIVESFGDGSLFSTVWPGLIEALAVEAALTESRADILEDEVPPSGQPDRFLAAVRALLLTFYERAPEVKRARETGQLLAITAPRGTIRGLAVDKDVFVHAVLVTDPRRRGTDAEDDFEPGVISRKARPTEAEKRWKDRRDGRTPTPRPPTPPDIPVPPK